MTWPITARFVKGVFVPDEPLELAENSEVHLYLQQNHDDTARSKLLRMVKDRALNRMKIDPHVAKAILEDRELDIDKCARASTYQS